MAKVLPLFLVVLVLASSVLLLAIPTQEQSANAYVNNDTNIMQYQLDNYTAFVDIPRVNNQGYKFQFDVNGYLPFELCYILLGTSQGIKIGLEYSSGVLILSSPSTHFNFEIIYNTLMPFRLELIVGPLYAERFRVHILINSEYIGYYTYYGEGYTSWSILFSDGVHIFDPYPYSYWSEPSSSNLAVFYSVIPSHSINVFARDWVDGANGYDAGYIDGMNEANDAKASLFSSLIGSIFAFFVSIASYEVLGISLLNIMIIVGSVLLLLAVLRVFLK